MKEFTQLQKTAIADSVAHGELKRITAHDNFRPGNHLGQTIKSLIDKGYFDVKDESRNGYPLIVSPTQKAMDYINIGS